MHSRSPDLEKRFRWVAGCFFAVAGPPAEGAVPKTTGAARSLDTHQQVSILHRSGQIVQRVHRCRLTHRRPAPTTLLYKAAGLIHIAGRFDSFFQDSLSLQMDKRLDWE